ncbi:MAG: hypothetical protein ACTSWW_03150 [Promethearchaeota archaeon]
MHRRTIHLTRFKWKLAAHKQPQNIQALWLYCSKGLLSFELEVNLDVEIPKSAKIHARYSKNLNSDNFIRVIDPKIIAHVGKEINNFTVKGALGKGILLGEITIPLGDASKTLPIMSTLDDWGEWWRDTHQNDLNRVLGRKV